jgi:hypothetical protein
MQVKMDEFGHGRALLLSIIVAYFALWISGKLVENEPLALSGRPES